VGSDSLASLESVWSFSKGDGDSEILIGVSGSNGMLYKIQPFSAEVTKIFTLHKHTFLIDYFG
jgi:hypothetical protein